MDKIRILFIGNSYTEYNNLPGMLQHLAASAGKPLETKMVTCGGKTLEWHCNNHETLDTIAEGGWEYVVLQEFSTRPLEEREKMYDSAAFLDRRIKEVNASTVLYLTWARQDMPEMQAELDDAYINLGKMLGAIIAPVGMAWWEANRTDPGSNLYAGDGSHPDITGTYLTACIFFAALFDETPVGLICGFRRQSDAIFMDIDKERAAFLQTVAWDTVQEFKKRNI